MRLDDAVAQLRSSMGDGPNAEMNINELDGTEVSASRVLNKVSSFPFLADKRLIIVKGLINRLMGSKGGKADLDMLVEELPKLPEYARLVFVERGSLRSNLRIVKVARQHGYYKEFSQPEDATQWIRQRTETEYNAQIDPAAAHALAGVTGGDLRRADNELVKLVSYVDGQRPVSEADVALLTPYVPEANVFDMIDALSRSDGKTALSLMSQALDEDASDPGFRMLGLITSHFKALLLVREYLDAGGNRNPKVMGKELGIHWYRAKKLSGQSRAFSVSQLEKIYRRLQQYDLEVKTGQIQIRFALELFVSSVARS
jgi:DNA polymerase-3 subunit delta